MLTLIFGCFFGLAIGLLAAVTPSFSTLQACMMAGVVAIISPAAVPSCLLTAFTLSMFLGSVKEAYSPEMSGNVGVIANSPLSPSTDLVWKSMWSKIAGCGTGLALGLLLTSVGIPMVPSAITLAVAVFLAWVLSSSFQGSSPLVIGYLFLSQAFFMFASATGMKHAIYVLCTSLYTIPACLGSQGKVNLTEQEQSSSPDSTKSLLAMGLSVLTPGVSPNLAVSALSRKRTVNTQLAATYSESLLETFGLVLLSVGIASSKTVLGIELGLASFSPALIPVFLLMILLSVVLLPFVSNVYQGIMHTPGVHLFAAASSVTTCFLLAGPIALVVVVCALLVQMILKSMNAPSQILSLTFLGPILF